MPCPAIYGLLLVSWLGSLPPSLSFMQIVQAVFGVFHHFELARELNRRGHLKTIYSTWPWFRLRREGIPHDKVETFPWIHTPEFQLTKMGWSNVWLGDQLSYANALAFDWWTDLRLPECDALVAISGAGLKTGRRLQAMGGRFVCDRGSSHQRYQERIVSEEFRRWGVERQVTDPRDIVREEEIYEVADVITVPSSFAARSFVEMGVAADKVRTIPYGVRLENYRRTGEPPKDRFEVLFAGSVGLRKGVPYLLEAFAQLKHPNKRLRIAGAVLDDIREVLKRLPTANVEFLGSVPQQELVELMSTSHVLVLPSIEEGLALVQGQALACGCPVIASTQTGGEDLFSDQVEGFIVPLRDSDAIANRLQQLADDPALQQRMSEAALARVRHIGGWAEYGDRWEKLLREITGKA